MTTRGKFRLDSKKEVFWNKEAREMEFSAVSDDGIPEHERYARFTPSGKLTILVDNPPVTDRLELGKNYYIDIIPEEEV
jgi:hypothetical protein